ncbi:MAG: undecaprenyl-phosphate glucose phosphotransferase [bacterium]|nr:undecaprenyl-phosphate glucose phosphotransferase [bacterium]
MGKRRYSIYFPILFLIADLISLNVSIGLANLYRFDNLLYVDEKYGVLHLFLNITWMAIFYSTKLHESNRESKILDVINKVLLALVINLSIIFAMWVATRSYFYSREHLFYTYLSFSFLIITWRVVFYYSIRIYRRKGYNYRNVMVVGYGETAHGIVNYIKNNPSLGYRFHGYLDNKEPIGKNGVIGNVLELEKSCKEHEIDMIFCCLPRLYDDEIKTIVDYAENNLIAVKVISRFSTLINKNLSIQRFGEIPVMNVGAIPLDNSFNRFIKRAFDIIFSLIVIISLLSWLMPLIALLIKLESKGPVFFRQYRNGRGNNKFKIFKFRTMKVHEDTNVTQAKKNDSRITKLGSFLRKTSIDELPQFLNVLSGDMSVVGPRPHAIPHNEEYQKKIDRFIQRHAVKPGITGLAQAKGYRGETTQFSAMYGRVKLDRFYVKNWSLLLDLKIILLTIVSVVRGQETAY